MSTWQQHTLLTTATKNANNGSKSDEISEGSREINHEPALSVDFGM